jgi:hypothetical protein
MTSKIPLKPVVVLLQGFEGGERDSIGDPSGPPENAYKLPETWTFGNLQGLLRDP